MTAQHHHRKRTLSSLVLVVLLLAGCADDIVRETAIQGVVVDKEGHAYPGVTVTLRQAGSTEGLRDLITSLEGSYIFTHPAAGSYEVAIEPPRASEVVDPNPAAVSVDEGTIEQADFTIQPLPIEARVVYGEDDTFQLTDIRNASGEKPESLDEPLYHANDPDELHPILAPDGHHVTLGEWRQASGLGRATCNGSNGTRYTLTLDGLIPNGVYTVQAVLHNFDVGPVRVGVGTLGPPGANVITASVSGEGLLEVTAPPGPMSQSGSAPECVLTQVESARVWVIYQIDGQPVEGAPGPNNEAWMEHMSFSF